MHGYESRLSTTSYDIIKQWLKCMVMDKYGNKMCLGWNEYSLEVSYAV